MDRPFCEDFSFFERIIREKGTQMPKAHFHDHHELYYLVKGKTKFFVGNRIYSVSPGDFILIPSGEYHQTDSMESENLERVLLIFKDDFVDERYREYLDWFLRIRHIHIHKEQTHLFNTLFREIESECAGGLYGCEDMKRLYLIRLLVLIKRYGSDAKSGELSGTSRIIEEAARFISTNCAEDLSLETLAHRYSISPGHFSKLFKKVTGMGLGEYITVSRISNACEMLSSGDKSITEVALRCGYNDSSYFTRVFKKIMGFTPKKYITK